ncbi:hypothetical protein P3S67_032445 [Capsicum chacoense]
MGMKSLEEAMEIYLDNLISSSLVIAFNEIGRSLTCQLHDLVHYFCWTKAKEEKLFDMISSSDFMPHTVTIFYDKEHIRPNNFILLNSKMQRHSGKHLYSLMITGDEMEDRPSDACHLRDLRLLKVLITDPSFMTVKDSLLNEIVLDIEACSFFDMDTGEPILIAEDSKLENLKELGKLVLSYSNETEDIFIKRYWFLKLDFLIELEFLKVKFESSNANDSGPSLVTNWSWDFHFPSNLKILVLWDFPLTSDSLSTIARLPNLEELFLTRTIIQGEEWNMGEEDTFLNLKYLNLDEVTLAKWEFGDESFRVLEKLGLWRCRKLEEIPPSFGYICSLKIIKLVESPQLEDSAKNIKQYVEDLGGDELLVLGPTNILLFK